jgi:exopolysaccharide biosynthesis polyprenyl glycosylphosphotransferase
MGLRFSERKLILAAGDIFALFTALYFSLLIDSRQSLTENFTKHFLWFLILVLIWLTIGSLLDIYNLARAASAFHSVSSVVTGILITILIYYLIPHLTPALPERRLQLFIFLGGSILGVSLWRIIYATIFTQPAFQQRALVVGAGWSGRTLAQAINEVGEESGNPYRGTGYHIIGFVDDDPAKQDTEIDGIPVLGDRHDLVRLVTELRPDELIVAITHSQIVHAELLQAILDIREMGVPITSMTNLYERMTGRVPVEHAGKDLWVVFPVSEPAGRRIYLAFRRIFEIGVALIGVGFLGVLIPFVWLANRLTDPGDVFYRQERVGQGGKHFQILKFRSMIMDAEKVSGAVWAEEDDPRITPAGRFLRKTRLDEIPQFWNVLQGKMSLIGPRPERPEFVDKLAQDIPFYRARHAVKPGITGWAQVKYRYGASVEDSLIKLQYDLYYIKRQGPYLDFLILTKTIQVVFGFRGR